MQIGGTLFSQGIVHPMGETITRDLSYVTTGIFMVNIRVPIREIRKGNVRETT